MFGGGLISKDCIKGIMVVDDYAHHPTEVKETIKATKNGWSKKLIVIFQPQSVFKNAKIL